MKTRTLKTLTALVLSAVMFCSAPVLAADSSVASESEILLDDGVDLLSADDGSGIDSTGLGADNTETSGSESNTESNTDSEGSDPTTPAATDSASDGSDNPDPAVVDGDGVNPDGEGTEGQEPSEELPEDITDGTSEEVTPIPEAEEVPEEDPEDVTPPADPAEDPEELAEEPTEEVELTELTALSFQDESLIALYNAQMNVSDGTLLARWSEVPGSLSAVSASLPGQNGADVDAMLRTYYAYTVEDLVGAAPLFTYPEGILGRWEAMKASMAGVSVYAALPSVDVMNVRNEGNNITVDTEEIYFVKASGADQSVVSYVFHNVFSFSVDEKTVILTGVSEYDSFYGTEEDYITLEETASYTGGKYGVAESAMVENAIQWALATAKDQTHGYSQARRWGPDYDCSSFVISSFGSAGFNLGYMNWPNDDDHEDDLYYTGNLKQPFIDAGFTWIPASELGGLDKPTNLKRGDIVLREYHHTEIYIGNGYLVGAHGCEKSDAHPYRSSETGDQADEVSVIKYTNYYGKGYDGVLRLLEEPNYATGSYTVTTSVNIRSGPSTCYDVLGTLTGGQVVNVVEVRGKWGRIGANRWFSLHYATPNQRNIPIADVTVTGVKASYGYTNKAIKPAVKLTYKGMTLKKGTHYTVAYSAYRRPGTAKIILTGDGDVLIGKRTIKYDIVPRVGTYRTTTAINLKAQTDANSQTLVLMPVGSYIYASGIKKVGSRYWARTSFGGKTGWFCFGYGDFLTSRNIATGMVTSGTIAPAKTYMIVSADDPLYAYGTASIKPGSYPRFYRVSRSTGKQRFRFVPSANGTYMIESAWSEQAVAPRSGKTGININLNLQTPSAAAIQSWHVRSNSDGTFSFLNAATGRAFRCEGGKAGYKTESETYTDKGTADQKFFLIEVPGVDNDYDGLYFIRKGTSSHVFMVKSKSTAVGAPLVLYKKTNAVSKKFRLIYSGSGYYRMIASNTGYAVTIKDNSNSIQKPLVMSVWKGNSSQLWKPVSNGDGTVRFVNPNGYAISLADNKIANGTVIRVDANKSTESEKWTLNRIS